MKVDLTKKPSLAQAKALNALAEAHGIKTNDKLIEEIQKGKA